MHRRDVFARCAATVAVAIMAAAFAAEVARGQSRAYRDVIRSTPGLLAYWRLGELSGSTATDELGRFSGAYLGGVQLGAAGALGADGDTAARFDGIDDAMEAGGDALALSTRGTIEGWFQWEDGVTLARDDTSAGGWILAYAAGGRVGYRVGGRTLLTSLPSDVLQDGWHHVVLTVDSGETALYVDGVRVHAGSGAGSAAALMPWRVMRNASFAAQSARGRADEFAIYAAALAAATVREHFEAGRDPADAAAPLDPRQLLRRHSPLLRYEVQETYFADSADEMTDNHVRGRHQNLLRSRGGQALAARRGDRRRVAGVRRVMRGRVPAA